MHIIKNSDFVHWHCHSEFSEFDGLAKLADLVLQARKMGFPALAITDHGVAAGWIKFIRECSKTKDNKGKDIPYDPIKSILGCEFYLCRKQEWKNKEKQPEGKSGNRHLNLYAMNWEGYQNLCTLSEKSWIDGFYYSPRIDLELIAKYSKGLMCGSACLSSLINSNLLHGRYDQAKKTCALLKDIFGKNFFLELMYHGIPEQRAILMDIIKLSKELDIPAVATNDCHYIHKSQGKSQEVLMCMSSKKCITNPKHLKHPYEEFYLKGANEMSKIFGHVPQTLTNTVALLERIDSKDISDNLFGGMRLPPFALPDGFGSSMEYLRHLAYEGMKDVGWANSEEHKKHLEDELFDIQTAWDINRYDFATYLLIVWDYINEARTRGIIVGCGRGSGYASILLRALRITYGADPLEHGLLFERFLGFDNKRFHLESDYGFADPLPVGVVNIKAEISRELEHDLGGVDRY